jgi:hypothetical protein
MRIVAIVLVVALSIPQLVAAQVPSRRLNSVAVVAASEIRQNLIKSVLFLGDQARAAKNRQTRLCQGQKLATLLPDELAKLAKNHQIEQDFAGGALTNQQLTYIDRARHCSACVADCRALDREDRRP